MKNDRFIVLFSIQVNSMNRPICIYIDIHEFVKVDDRSGAFYGLGVIYGITSWFLD